MSNYNKSNQRGYREPQQPSAPDNSNDFDTDWVKVGLTSETIKFAKKFGDFLVNGFSKREDPLTTSQIRNVYGEVKRIQLKGIQKHKTDFLLLQPKLAYAAKRSKSKGAQKFEKVMQKALIAVDIDKEGFDKRFVNFCQLFEAVLAYHKAAGGRD